MWLKERCLLPKRNGREKPSQQKTDIDVGHRQVCVKKTMNELKGTGGGNGEAYGKWNHLDIRKGTGCPPVPSNNTTCCTLDNQLVLLHCLKVSFSVVSALLFSLHFQLMNKSASCHTFLIGKESFLLG